MPKYRNLIKIRKCKDPRIHLGEGLLRVLFLSFPEECSRLSLENEATRGKMEQLQLMLEERRARRRTRRVLHAPYPTSWSVPVTGATAGPESPVAGAVDTLIGETDKIKTDGGAMSPASDAPMDCDALADDAMEGESAATANEYLKLNPETVVA